MTTISKNQNLLTKFFAKNNPVESTDYETGLPDVTLTEAKAKILMKVQVLKLKSVKSKMSRSREFSWLIDDYNNYMYVMYCYICRKAGPDIAGKIEFVLEKSLNVKVLFIKIKLKV